MPVCWTLSHRLTLPCRVEIRIYLRCTSQIKLNYNFTSKTLQFYFYLVSGDSGTFGRKSCGCYEPIRNEYPCHLCSSPSPSFQQSGTAPLVCPAQVPPQSFSTCTTCPTLPSRSVLTSHTLTRSLTWFISTQFQPNKEGPSSSRHPIQSSACRGRVCRSQRSDSLSSTAVTYAFILWNVKCLYSLSQGKWVWCTRIRD